jgi:hypothetical protein
MIKGLTPGAFKAMRRLNSTRTAPPHDPHLPPARAAHQHVQVPGLALPHRRVAAQVAFESKGFKPEYHISVSRVETRRVQALWDQLDSTCTDSTCNSPTVGWITPPPGSAGSTAGPGRHVRPWSSP